MFEYHKSLSNEDDNEIDVCDHDGDEETHQSLNFAFVVMLEDEISHISSGHHAEEERQNHILCEWV